MLIACAASLKIAAVPNQGISTTYVCYPKGRTCIRSSPRMGLGNILCSDLNKLVISQPFQRVYSHQKGRTPII